MIVNFKTYSYFDFLTAPQVPIYMRWWCVSSYVKVQLLFTHALLIFSHFRLMTVMQWASCKPAWCGYTMCWIFICVFVFLAPDILHFITKTHNQTCVPYNFIYCVVQGKLKTHWTIACCVHLVNEHMHECHYGQLLMVVIGWNHAINWNPQLILTTASINPMQHLSCYLMNLIITRFL